MNQELLDLLRDILSQVIAGIPFGAILSLIIYYALNKIKEKTSEFPEKATEIELKVKDFSKEDLTLNRDYIPRNKKEAKAIKNIHKNCFINEISSAMLFDSSIGGGNSAFGFSFDLMKTSPDGNVWKLDWSIDNNGNITWSPVKLTT